MLSPVEAEAGWPEAAGLDRLAVSRRADPLDAWKEWALAGGFAAVVRPARLPP